MSYHEFGIMQTAPKSKKRYDTYEPKKYDCISVADDYLENIITKIENIDMHWHTLDSHNKGLAYCGITLIPPKSIQKFVSVIETEAELCELKELLSKAYKENKWIIHFGI